MNNKKVIDLTTQQPKEPLEETKEQIQLRENEIDFIVTMIKSGRTLKEIGESILKIYKQRKPRTRVPKKYFESNQTTGSEEVEIPTKPEKQSEPEIKDTMPQESFVHERPAPTTQPPNSRPASSQLKEQLKESFVLPSDAENIIRILSQRLQNTVEVKIQYLVDEKRILQVGATRPLYDKTIEQAHDELYVTVLKSLNNLLAKTV